MSRALVTVTGTTTVSEAEEAARRRKIRHVLVMRGRHLIAVLSRRDFHTASPRAIAVECAERHPITIAPSATADETAALMRVERIGCIPVVMDGLVVGVVTRGDLRRRGFSDEALGVRRCACCGYHHNVETEPGAPDAGFCLFCRERAEPDLDLEIGGGG